MNARARFMSLLACSIVVAFALATGAFASSTAAVALEPADYPDVDADRSPLAGPRGPRHEAPPPEADDEGDEDEPRTMRPPRRRGEFGRGGEDRPRRGRGGRGKPFDGDGPPHRGRGAGRDFPHPRFELTEEVVQQVMAFLEENLPDWHKHLVRLRDERPEAFRGALRRVIPLVEEYNHLQETNPELAQKVLEEFRIEHKLRKLARQYMEAKGDAEAQARIEAQIAPLVREQLQIRLLRDEARLDKMEKRLAEARTKLEAEREQIDTSVAKRVKQIKKGKFRERGRNKSRRDRKGRRGFRDGPRHRGPRGNDDGPDHPRHRGPPPEDDL